MMLVQYGQTHGVMCSTIRLIYDVSTVRSDFYDVSTARSDSWCDVSTVRSHSCMTLVRSAFMMLVQYDQTL
jgi:hypothetical protein